MDTTKSLINKKKMQAFFAYVIKREKLEHLVTTRMIEGKHSSRKQQEKMLDGLAKRLNVG